MRINHLDLQQFRNIDSLSLDFPHNLNVFVGDNGQGKTNIIESLVFLSSGRSFRVNDDEYLIQHDKTFARIEANLEPKQHLRVVISNQGKFLQVNQSVIKKLSDFMGYCNVVLFNPDDLNFFTEAPRKRRRDVDFEMGKLSRRYLELLSTSSKLLAERNAHLKTRKIDDDYLNIVTDQLIAQQIPIIKQRHAFCERITPLVNHYYQKMSLSDTRLSLEYKGCVELGETLEENLIKRYHDTKQRDIEFRMTHIGVHRDDFVFKFNDEPVTNVASQGQKRMIMVAYKLALVDLIYKNQGFYPILCLDDLFSELDETRRRMVLEMIPAQMQTFITTTDLSFIQTDRTFGEFMIHQGIVNKEED